MISFFFLFKHTEGTVVVGLLQTSLDAETQDDEKII